jgi:hypothetical protein
MSSVKLQTSPGGSGCEEADQGLPAEAAKQAYSPEFVNKARANFKNS